MGPPHGGVPPNYGRLNLHNLEGRFPWGRSQLSHDLHFHQPQGVRLRPTRIGHHRQAAIQYPASKVDDVDDGDDSTGDVVEDDNDEDDSDDDLDEDLHKMVTEIATKMDDSSFRSEAEDKPKLEVISGPGTSWMGKVPSYSLKVVAVGSQSGMHMASHSEEVTRSSFDAFLKEHADGSSVGELMGGQALLRDYTTAVELKQLCKLANEQVSITCCFDAKFSDTAFTLLQKIHEAFIGTSGIAQKFINDMATVALNFIRDVTAHETELLASDSMAFMARLACIREPIADLIKRRPQLLNSHMRGLKRNLPTSSSK